MSDQFVHPSVPDELWLAVFVGVIAEDEAIARGRRAAATSPEARRAILFPETPELRRPPYRPTGSPPWQEP